MHYKLNTPGQADGISEVWYRPENTGAYIKVQDIDDYNIRNSFTNGLRRFEVQSFPGGNTIDYQESHDRFVKIKDVGIYNYDPR